MDILVVDDSKEYLSLLQEVLFSSGYTVHVAANGIAACEILTTSEIDLIISDVQMPKMDGIKFHEFTREVDRYKNTNFIFLSGAESELRNSLELDPRIDHFFPKTTPIWDVARAVDELIFGEYATTWLFQDRKGQADRI